MAKMKIKGTEYEVADSLVPAVQSVIDDNETLATALKDSEAKVSKQTALYDAEHEKTEEMKKKLEDDDDEDEKDKKVEDAANKRLTVLLSASKFLKDYDPSGKSLVEIKTDVLTDALPELDLTDKNEEYINTRFEILCEDGKIGNGQQKLNDGLSRQMGTGEIDVNDAVAVARAKKIKKAQGAYLTDAQRKAQEGGE